RADARPCAVPPSCWDHPSRLECSTKRRRIDLLHSREGTEPGYRRAVGLSTMTVDGLGGVMTAPAAEQTTTVGHGARAELIAHGLLFVTAILWGSSFVAVK